MKCKLYIVFLLCLITACGGFDCDKLPKSYRSSEEAIRLIETANFRISESVNTSKSSWVRGASYYSCDGLTGFFILKTDNQKYLYSKVPIEVWKSFKIAKSFGSYYNSNIKNRYTFQLINH